MTGRARSVVLALALSCVALGASAAPAGAAPSQDPTSTAVSFGAEEATTTVAASVADVVPETTQEVTEGTSSESRLLTESRKLVATIGGLVVAALGLTLLTIRYWRATRPIDDTDLQVPVMGTEAALGASAVASAPATEAPEPLATPAVPPTPPPAAPAPARMPVDVPSSEVQMPSTVTDTAEHEAILHQRADEDYEPQGTGEHERVEIPARPGRPGRGARAAALGRTTVP
ncbi:MAG: hypothetical protein KDB21_18125 [Acidimicrobiales bacterium]|nr:hypothetical protein [Acidimicrobiales bacterium]